MYPVCLDINISPVDFWELSVGEILSLIESHNRKEKARKKEELSDIYLLAKQIGNYVSTILNGGERPQEVWEVYPELFEEERKIIEEQQRQQQLALYKARFEDFVLRHNRKFERKEESIE